MKKATSKGIEWLHNSQIDYIFARSLKEVEYFSHEHASALYKLLAFLFRNTNRRFTPFYDDAHSINNQVRNGLILQSKIMPARFTLNPAYDDVIEEKAREICGAKYRLLEEFVSDMARESPDGGVWLKHMEKAIVAYKLPEHKRTSFLVNSGIERDRAFKLLRELETYVQKWNES